MIYHRFKDIKLSQLGFGTMRLPLLEDGSIDQTQVEEMFDLAISSGVNYFDTAYPYLGGQSEGAVGKALSRYPRDSYYIATKFPGHQHMALDPEAIFERQLERLQTDHIDFYLLHNINEGSFEDYTKNHPEWMEYFKQQKENGRITYLGFSTHARYENLVNYIESLGDYCDFVQIQFNYMDYSFQSAKEKYEFLTAKGIPVFVMEPVRGGALCNLTDNQLARLHAFQPKATAAEFGYRFVQQFENVAVCLSGMSSLQQMKENLQTFEEFKALTNEEVETLFAIADEKRDSIPCTKCRYCCDGCPMGLDIPLLIQLYNELKFNVGMNTMAQLEALPADKLPHSCIACGQCSSVCPQGIEIPTVLALLADKFDNTTKWADICAKREEEMKKDFAK